MTAFSFTAPLVSAQQLEEERAAHSAAERAALEADLYGCNQQQHQQEVEESLSAVMPPLHDLQSRLYCT